MHKFKVFDLCLIAILSAILVIQEMILQFLPNIQLTVFLIVVISKKLGLFKSLTIVFIYSLLDCLFAGSFNILYFPVLLIGWSLIPITLNTIFNKVNSPFCLAIIGVIHSFIYCWLFFIPTIILTNVKLLDYFISDFLFEILLACSSFLTILWLYKPISNIFDKLLKKE